MIPQLLDLVSPAANHLTAVYALAIAAAGLFIALLGARFGKPLIALSLLSAGTVIGLKMPHWFGWGIDPMGTAFGMAILLGMSGYVLTALWEGILFSALLAAAAGLAVWLKLAPHEVWHLPVIDWSQTSLEIAAKIRLSLPSALTTVLPVVIGIGATVGALLMVIGQKFGRVLFYSLLGTGLFIAAGSIALQKLQPSWLASLPQDIWTATIVLSVSVIVAMVIQWWALPRPSQAAPAATSENKLHLNQFVARGPAMRVQAAEARVLLTTPKKLPAGAMARPARGRLR